MNRYVRKGEKSIGILAPLRKKITDQDTGDERWGLYGFRRASVFDISSTEGEPLPEVPVPVLDSDAGGELYARLEDVARDEGLTVQRGHERFGAREQMMGFYERESRLIAVRDDVSQLQATKTLAHEAAHHFANHQVSGPESETEAESIAYVVCARFGLDTAARSFPYVATWSKDATVFKAAMARIQQVSSRIIGHLEPSAPPRSGEQM